MMVMSRMHAFYRGPNGLSLLPLIDDDIRNVEEQAGDQKKIWRIYYGNFRKHHGRDFWTSSQASASPTAVPAAPPSQPVDAAAIVDKAAAASGEKLA